MTVRVTLPSWQLPMMSIRSATLRVAADSAVCTFRQVNISTTVHPSFMTSSMHKLCMSFAIRRRLTGLPMPRWIVSRSAIFLSAKGSLMLPDESLLPAFAHCRKIGAMPEVHAENGDVVEYMQKKLLAEGVGTGQSPRSVPRRRNLSFSKREFSALTRTSAALRRFAEKAVIPLGQASMAHHLLPCRTRCGRY